MNPYAPPTGSGHGAGGHGAGGHARLEGDVLVVTRDAGLPAVCLKCGTRAGIMRREQKFQWTPLWARMSLVFCTIGGLIAMAVTTKRATLSLPLCVPCNGRWTAAMTVMIVSVIALVLSVFGFRVVDEPGAVLGIFGVIFVGFLVLMLTFVRPRMLQVHKIDDREVHLKNFHRGAGEEIAGKLA